MPQEDDKRSKAENILPAQSLTLLNVSRFLLGSEHLLIFMLQTNQDFGGLIL